MGGGLKGELGDCGGGRGKGDRNCLRRGEPVASPSPVIKDLAGTPEGVWDRPGWKRREQDFRTSSVSLGSWDL